MSHSDTRPRKTGWEWNWLPTWQKPLQEVLSGLDLEELGTKVQDAQTAILLRLQELSVVAGSHDELDALRKACEVLLEIETRRLKKVNNFGCLRYKKELFSVVH